LALAWLEANAASFDSSDRQNEPWHWEYVDVPIARGATKRVSRKVAKPANVVGRTKRPARRLITVGTAPSSSDGRVTSSPR
jgi:hypothetical protein